MLRADAVQPHSSVLTLLDWSVLLFYVISLCAIAYSASRQVHAHDDYFLAGRSMSRWPIAMSMYVALFSTNTFVGMTGWLNRPMGPSGSASSPLDLSLPFHHYCSLPHNFLPPEDHDRIRIS